MTIQEYRKEVSKIEDDLNEERKKRNRELTLKYINERVNPVKKGDIITSPLGSIKVEVKGVGRYFVFSTYEYIPCFSYRGTQVTKKGEPTKKQSVTSMSEDQIQTINGKQYNYYQEVVKKELENNG